MSANEADLRFGALRLDRFGDFAVVLQRRRGRVDDDVVKAFGPFETLFDVDVVRRAIEQRAVGRERGWLREPCRIPIRRHFATRLVTRTGAAIKSIKTRG